jgi:hypothetical protein
MLPVKLPSFRRNIPTNGQPQSKNSQEGQLSTLQHLARLDALQEERRSWLSQKSQTQLNSLPDEIRRFLRTVDQHECDSEALLWCIENGESGFLEQWKSLPQGLSISFCHEDAYDPQKLWTMLDACQKLDLKCSLPLNASDVGAHVVAEFLSAEDSPIQSITLIVDSASPALSEAMKVNSSLEDLEIHVPQFGKKPDVATFYQALAENTSVQELWVTDNDGRLNGSEAGFADMLQCRQFKMLKVHSTARTLEITALGLLKKTEPLPRQLMLTEQEPEPWDIGLNGESIPRPNPEETQQQLARTSKVLGDLLRAGRGLVKCQLPASAAQAGSELEIEQLAANHPTLEELYFYPYDNYNGRIAKLNRRLKTIVERETLRTGPNMREHTVDQFTQYFATEKSHVLMPDGSDHPRPPLDLESAGLIAQFMSEPGFLGRDAIKALAQSTPQAAQGAAHGRVEDFLIWLATEGGRSSHIAEHARKVDFKISEEKYDDMIGQSNSLKYKEALLKAKEKGLKNGWIIPSNKRPT